MAADPSEFGKCSFPLGPAGLRKGLGRAWGELSEGLGRAQANHPGKPDDLQAREARQPRSNHQTTAQTSQTTTRQPPDHTPPSPTQTIEIPQRSKITTRQTTVNHPGKPDDLQARGARQPRSNHQTTAQTSQTTTRQPPDHTPPFPTQTIEIPQRSKITTRQTTVNLPGKQDDLQAATRCSPREALPPPDKHPNRPPRQASRPPGNISATPEKQGNNIPETIQTSRGQGKTNRKALVGRGGVWRARESTL